MYEAGKARSESDWLIGMNGTRAVTINVGDRIVWSVGRVQTHTLCMICKRYLENKNFKSKPYWVIKAEFNKNGISFFGTNPTKFMKHEDAEAMLQSLSSSSQGVVVKVEKKTSYSKPPLLYDLTSIQKDANTRYGFSAETTLKLCQLLYEKKLTTYPRTSSRYIPDDVYQTLPMLIRNAESYDRFADYAKSLKGKPLGRISVNADKVTEHHALLPTENKPKEGSMTEAEKKLYEMILARLLETVSPREEKFVATATIHIVGEGRFPFTVKGSTVISSGWKAVLNEKQKTGEDENERLPELSKDERLDIHKFHMLDEHTKTTIADGKFTPGTDGDSR